MTKTRILVVEDEFITATDIRNSLEGMGYEVPAVIDTGDEAIRKAGELRPSLVLMDIGLAGKMTGIEAATQIRERFGIPVIYLTAHSDESTFWSTLASEPSGYLIKPFEARELQFNIEMALHKQQRKTGGTGETGENVPKRRGGEIPPGIRRKLPLVGILVCAALVIAFMLHPSGLSLPGRSAAAMPAAAGEGREMVTQTPYEKNVEVVREIAGGYHDTHTYVGVQTGQSSDVFACLDMAKDIWNMVKTRGINAVIEVGNVKRNISSIHDVNHAWVLAEVAPMRWIAIETTGGYLVTREENPLYYDGMQFGSPADLREYSCGKGYCWSNTCVHDMCQDCSPGYLLGTDLQCHLACGSGYCTENRECVNGECVSCNPGYVFGTDNRCHPPCVDANHYCLSGFVCGLDNKCHPG